MTTIQIGIELFCHWPSEDKEFKRMSWVKGFAGREHSADVFFPSCSWYNKAPRPGELASVGRRYGFWGLTKARTWVALSFWIGFKGLLISRCPSATKWLLGVQVLLCFKCWFNCLLWRWITRCKTIEVFDNSRVTLHKPSIVPSKAKELPQLF